MAGSKSTVAGFVQGSNLVASQLERALEWRLKNGGFVNCRYAFLRKSTGLISGLRLSAELKGKRKSTLSFSASVIVLTSGDAAEVKVETGEGDAGRAATVPHGIRFKSVDRNRFDPLLDGPKESKAALKEKHAKTYEDRDPHILGSRIQLGGGKQSGTG